MKKNYLLTILSILFCFAIQAQVSYSGNGNTGFGGDLGSNTLSLSDDGTTITFDFASTIGGNNIVIYIDSKTGGFPDTTTFTDDADGGRSATSTINGGNDPEVTFPTGFTADYAVVVGNSFAILFELSTGSHTVTGLTYTSGDTSVTFAQLGMASTDKFDFVAILNSDTSFLSDEVIGDSSVSGNPGFAGSITFTGDRSYPNTWTGTTDTDWSTATNWTNGIPDSNDNIFIPSGLTNYPSASSAVTINKGIVQSGASLIADNAGFTGTITYERTLGSTNWYLMSSPVSGVTFNDTFVGDNNIDDTNGSGNNRGVASYLTASNTWSYLQSLGSMSADSGTGYSVKQDVAGTVSFTGTINTADVNANIAFTGDGFNLVGNPFAAHINAKTFLDANSNLDQTQLWVWNQASGMYEVKTNESGFILAPTQGFFVKANSGTQVTFAATNQAASGGTFQKSANATELTLFMTNGDKNRFAKIYYAETATKGFDYGWEGEVFGGIPNSLDVYTNLIDENQGKKYQVQSLPKNEMESMVIPVGVIAEAGEIEFSAESMNLPAGLKVFLEDRTTNTFTRLDEANASYKVTLSEKTNEIGRFYLHTKSAALSTDSVELSNINMYTTNSTTLRIVGLSKGQASLKIFNILGKQVLETTFNSNGVYDVNLPALNTGVYIAQLENDNGKINKKIVLE